MNNKYFKNMEKRGNFCNTFRINDNLIIFTKLEHIKSLQTTAHWKYKENPIFSCVYTSRRFMFINSTNDFLLDRS